MYRLILCKKINMGLLINILIVLGLVVVQERFCMS